MISETPAKCLRESNKCIFSNREIALIVSNAAKKTIRLRSQARYVDWTFSPRKANLFNRARYPSGKGEVCKTFMRRFDSDPRLHPRMRTSSGCYGFADGWKASGGSK
jgi:hypothetical protein